MIDEIIPFSVICHNFGIEKKKLCEFLCSKNVAPGHIIQHLAIYMHFMNNNML